MASFSFEELTRADGLKSAVSAEDGGGTCIYRLSGVDDTTPPTVAQLSAFANFLCGGVDNLACKVVSHSDNPDYGKVIRRLPRVHPFMPELSIAGISGIVGDGTQSEADSLQILGIPAVTEQFAHFTKYDYLTEFKKRPYFLVPNEFIGRKQGTYYPPVTPGASPASGITYYYAEEWLRYCSRSLAPMPDTVNATTGAQMKFRTASDTAPGGPTASQYPGNVNLYLQNQLLEISWYQVPFRYFFPYTSGATTYKPYLTRFVNYVNQYDWNGFGKGTLLYLGATPASYIPMSPVMPQILGLGLSQSQDLLCNVKLRFLYTSREGTDVPTTGHGLDDLNNIAAGHNLQPRHVDRRFYYTTGEDPGNPTEVKFWKPSFPSFPFELLFTDPLLIQGGTI